MNTFIVGQWAYLSTCRVARTLGLSDSERISLGQRVLPKLPFKGLAAQLWGLWSTDRLQPPDPSGTALAAEPPSLGSPHLLTEQGVGGG